MKPSKYDAVMGSCPTVPQGSLILGGEEGKNREFSQLLKIDPARAIQTELGKEKFINALRTVWGVFNDKCQLESSTFTGEYKLALSSQGRKIWSYKGETLKFRRFSRDEHLRVYYLPQGGYYAGQIFSETFFSPYEYHSHTCPKSLRGEVIRALILFE